MDSPDITELGRLEKIFKTLEREISAEKRKTKKKNNNSGRNKS